MQNEKDYLFQCKDFLQTLDFVRILQKTVYVTSVLEILGNNLCFNIVNAN